MDFKKRRHLVDSKDALVSAIRDDRAAEVALIWTPDHRHMILPEELGAATQAVVEGRKTRARDDWQDGRYRSGWLGILIAAYAVYLMAAAWVMSGADTTIAERLAIGFKAVMSSMPLGIGLLLILIMGFIPWYQGRKRLRELSEWTESDTEALIPVLRFETWLDTQKVPVTRCLMGLVALVGLVQIIGGDSIQAAGLVKHEYADREWWRLFSYSMLHGNLIHFLMNAAALLYLGRRIEVFAGWPHLLMVFSFASIVGGECSVHLLDATTVGSSGGLMGWLGFLLVFESLHKRLVPRSARRRLLAGVILTAVIGLAGYRFIDNAVHAGGLFAGMLYAAIVFMKSHSCDRPRVMKADWVAGCLAGLVVLLTAGVAVVKILGH